MSNPAQATPPDYGGSCSKDTTPRGRPPVLEQLPAALTAGPFVNYTTRPKANGKLDKIPLDPNTADPFDPAAPLRHADMSNPETFGTYDQAVANLARDGVAGLSRAMTLEDDVVGLDWDDCVDPETDAIDPDVLAEVQALGCYTEYSPSRRGVRGFLRGQLPVDGRKKGKREAYQAKRHLTVTGWHVDGTPLTLELRQAELDAWYLEHFGPAPAQRERVNPATITRLDDQELLTKARAAKNGPKFSGLYDQAPPAEDPRASEDDQALANEIVFWSQDPAQVRRLMEGSARRRSKWYDRRGAGDWLDLTIDKALADVRETYSGGRTWEAPTEAPTDTAAAAATPAIMAELAQLRAERDAWRRRAEQAEAFNRALLKAQANPYLRNEVRLIVAEATGYASALSRGAVDGEGLSWLYIGSKDDDGLAGQSSMSPRTISRQLKRHATYEIDGQPLVELHEDEVEGSDGKRRSRYRYKVPFLEQGGTIPELVAKIADYEPPGVAEGERHAPGGPPGHCSDCGGALERDSQILERVRRVEKYTERCTACGLIHDEGEKVLSEEEHVIRARVIRLDLPTSTAGVAEEGSPAIMAEVVDVPDAAPSSTSATVESHYGATPCPVVAEPLPPAAFVAEAAAVVGAVDVEPLSTTVLTPELSTRVNSMPQVESGPALPPGFAHWCPGHPATPLPANVERCSRCTRTWRPPAVAEAS
jgi:putative DNA primase/helicase